jgi:aldoxime dehydratase
MTDKPITLERSIPDHLQVPRTRPLGAPADFVPNVSSYSARFAVSVKAIPMAFFGVQSRQKSAESDRAVAALEAGFSGKDAPKFWDRAEYEDEVAHFNNVIVGYWDDLPTYQNWQTAKPADWWRVGTSLNGELGVFRECYTPGIEDTETTFGHPYPEGYSKIADRMSGPTDSHLYWGSARDRIPRSQTDALEPAGRPKAASTDDNETLGRHIVVEPHENLCLLRSGQDWSIAGDEERQFYFEHVKPLLDIGMKEIRDEGRAFGCFFNRYMYLVDRNVRLEKTYSLSAWHSLADLETWCKSGTHLRIFNAGIKHYRTAGDKAMLRLYHEMSVIRAKDQVFEYFNCHRRTGMLNAISSSESPSSGRRTVSEIDTGNGRVDVRR